MRTRDQHGFTLLELIAFIVIVSIALVGLMTVFDLTIRNSVDPTLRTRALEIAQAKMDEITGRKYDENTPTGGIPACNSGVSGAVTCAGIGQESGAGDFNDVDDYNNQSSTDVDGYATQVSVVFAGSELPGVSSNTAIKRVTVTVTPPGGSVGSVTLMTYLANY